MVILTASVAPALAQSTETFVLLRTATERGAYHLAEVSQQRGKIIAPDIGYIDFGDAKAYRELWIGGGGVPFSTKQLTFIAEAFILKAFGPRSGDALYFEPWFLAILHIAPRIGGEVSYFPYVPLNDAGRAQHVLERAKLEYDFTYLKVGAGYAAYKFGAQNWQHRPFITTTLKAGQLGNLELWLQRLPQDELTVQIRWAKIFHH